MTPSEIIKYLNDLLYQGPPATPFSSLSQPYLDVLTESATGTDSVYALTYTPYDISTLLVFLDGNNQTDFILTGNSIDFTVNVPQGVRVTAWYIYQS